MKQLPNKYDFPDKPITVKKTRARLLHVSPPIKGLMDDAKTQEADQKFAAILTNLYVNDDRLTARAGFEKIATMPGAKAVDHLVPYYGDPQRLLAATNNTLCDAVTGTMLKAGFTSNDWHWTTHSDLGDIDRTVMVNGNDGVWSWDGLANPDNTSLAATVTTLAKTNPARVTLAAGFISRFANGDSVTFSGADAGHISANGVFVIGSVNSPANTFTLVGLDGTPWTADQTTGTMLATKKVTYVVITKIAKAVLPATNAVVTVEPGTITGLKNNDAIIVSGADTAHAAANGSQRITKVNDVPNTFELVDINTSGWGGDQTTGTMQAVKQGSFVLEAIKAPTGNTWLKVNDLSIVVAHMNRLFFTDEDNLAVYYLPLQQRYGELRVLPMNAIFRRGGYIKAMATWTVDGGHGMDDQLVLFSSNGEIAIYSGIDPAEDFTLVGVFRMEAPMNKWCVLNYGGELYFLSPNGLIPMSAVLKSGREGMEASDKTVVSRFLRNAILFRNNLGWELQFNPNSGRAMCNIPLGGGNYMQMTRNMAKPSWGEWQGVPSRCWGWIEPYLYFGDDLGNMYRMHPNIQHDNGKPIIIDMQTAWSQYKTPAIKHFKMILPYILTDGYPTPALDMQVDYDNSKAVNVPTITESSGGDATWDVAKWPEDPTAGPNDSFWVYGAKNWSNWTGVGTIGRVGAIRMSASVYNCSFSILGWDVLYDSGSVFG